MTADDTEMTGVLVRNNDLAITTSNVSQADDKGGLTEVSQSNFPGGIETVSMFGIEMTALPSQFLCLFWLTLTNTETSRHHPILCQTQIAKLSLQLPLAE